MSVVIHRKFSVTENIPLEAEEAGDTSHVAVGLSSFGNHHMSRF